MARPGCQSSEEKEEEPQSAREPTIATSSKVQIGAGIAKCKSAAAAGSYSSAAPAMGIRQTAMGQQPHDAAPRSGFMRSAGDAGPS